MKIMSMEEFRERMGGANFPAAMMTVALDLLHIKYTVTISHNKESILETCQEIMLKRGLDLDNSLVIYTQMDDKFMPSLGEVRWICACFEIVEPEDLARAVNKVNKVKAFL